MKKKIFKVSLVIILIQILFAIICMNTGKVTAFGVEDFTGTKVISSEPVDFGNQIITVLTTIGVSTSVIVLIILGLKYMMGSVEEKAEYKKSMKPYVIGAFLVFAASTIAGVIFNVAKNLG